MPHWKSFYIERFRRLENLRLEDLGTVNILVGKNNSGKTSVLEALAIASHPTSPFTWIEIGRERELKSARTPALEILHWCFPHNAEGSPDGTDLVAFEGKITTGETLRIEARYQEFRELKISPSSTQSSNETTDEEQISTLVSALVIETKRIDSEGHVRSYQGIAHQFRGEEYRVPEPTPPFFPFQFVSPVSHRTSRQLLAAVDKVMGERLKPEVIRLLKLLSEDVEDIEIRSPEGRGAVVHLYHAKIGSVPLSVEGDGMRRALAFAAATALAKNGLLLVDEVETALHPDALASIFRFLVQICEATGVQLFVTTHSLEAVDAMLASVGNITPDLVAYRLPPRGSDLPVKRFSRETLHDLRHEGGLDIR